MKLHQPAYLALVLSLPTKNSTVRMRVWRALKALGCGVLRDGVYLLPASVVAREALQQQADAVRGAGGSAQILLADPPEEARQEFVALFDRAPAYTSLMRRIDALNKKLGGGNRTDIQHSFKQCQRDFHLVEATDYFPGPAQAQVAQALTQLEASIQAWLSPGEPHGVTGTIERLDRADYQGRIWATRARLWVDRVASAWLIQRFIDRRARFIWLKDPKKCPRTALGFDYDGARFTHIGARVTFEALLASFGLEADPVLRRIGALVHYLDVGGVPVAEAPGVVRLLEGLRHRTRNDDTFLREAGVSLDALYTAYAQGENQTPGADKGFKSRQPKGANDGKPRARA